MFSLPDQQLKLGCAGWSVPGTLPEEVLQRFPVLAKHQQSLLAPKNTEQDAVERQTHLQRYATFFPSVEINSSFYRAHAPKTYERWRSSVPDHFRFSVKLPKAITHILRLKNCETELRDFLQQTSWLQNKLGCLLIQLPPSLAFEKQPACDFLSLIQQQTAVPLALEPRHSSWFKPAAIDLLMKKNVALADTDPRPAGITIDDFPQTASTVYRRLHGSPHMYYSSYGPEYLVKLSQELRTQRAACNDLWCVFDNTAQGAAFWNALLLHEMTQQTDIDKESRIENPRLCTVADR